MELPIDKEDKEAKYKLLAEYGETIYKSIAAGNPDAVWVTQGWTFGYQHSFWDKESLKALLSNVPDDKMISLIWAMIIRNGYGTPNKHGKYMMDFTERNGYSAMYPTLAGKTP